MADPDNKGSNDPGFAPRPDPTPFQPELADLSDKISSAIEAVTTLGKAQADIIVAKINAEARAKEWADIAYEMWALVVNSVHDGHGSANAPAMWAAQKNDLRDRLHAALDSMPEDVKP